MFHSPLVNHVFWVAIHFRWPCFNSHNLSDATIPYILSKWHVSWPSTFTKHASFNHVHWVNSLSLKCHFDHVYHMAILLTSHTCPDSWTFTSRIQLFHPPIISGFFSWPVWCLFLLGSGCSGSACKSHVAATKKSYFMQCYSWSVLLVGPSLSLLLRQEGGFHAAFQNRTDGSGGQQGYSKHPLPFALFKGVDADL